MNAELSLPVVSTNKKISSKTHETQVIQLETKLTPQKMF